MGKNAETIDREIVKSIKKSAEKFKQMYPILLDANEEIIDGQHRRMAFNNPETRKLDFIRTKKERLEARLVANHARKGQGKKYWEPTLNELALILQREGVDKIGIKISEETGLPYRTIMRYLSSEFKDQAQSQRASHPRLPTVSREKKLETEALAKSLVPSPAKTTPEKTTSESEVSQPVTGEEILEEYKVAKEEEMPRVKIQRFSNQPWKAIIVPKDFFEKLDKACIRRKIDIERAVTLALLKLLEDLRSKAKCLEEMK